MQFKWNLLSFLHLFSQLFVEGKNSKKMGIFFDSAVWYDNALIIPKKETCILRTCPVGFYFTCLKHIHHGSDMQMAMMATPCFCQKNGRNPRQILEIRAFGGQTVSKFQKWNNQWIFQTWLKIIHFYHF